MSLRKQEINRALELIEDFKARQDLDSSTVSHLIKVSELLQSPLLNSLFDIQESYEISLIESLKVSNCQEIQYWEHKTDSSKIVSHLKDPDDQKEVDKEKYRPSSSDEDQNNGSDVENNRSFNESRSERRICSHPPEVSEGLVDQNEYEQAPFQTSLPLPVASSSAIYNTGHCYEYDHITLERGKTVLGFSIAGGRDIPLEPNDPTIYITKIIPGGAAEIDQRLRVNDAILMVNGVDMTNVNHSDAVNALKIAGSTVNLKVRRVVADVLPRFSESLQPEEDTNIREHIIDIHLVKGCKGLGFSIAGGVGNQHIVDDNGIYVTKIISGGAAAEDGKLKVGDRILTVDGRSVIEVSHEHAVRILQQTTDIVNLRVLRHQANHSPSHRPSYISSSYISSRCDTSAVVDHVIKTPPITPVLLPPPIPEQRQLEDLNNAQHSAHAHNSFTSEEIPPALPPPPSSYQFGSEDYSEQEKLESATTALIDPPNLTDQFISSDQSKDDLRTVELQRSVTGLGFNIVGGSEKDGIFVSHITPGGAADVDGKLRAGDQILSVNGIELSKTSHKDAVEILKGTGFEVSIVVQYKPEEFKIFQAKNQIPQENSGLKMSVMNNSSFSVISSVGGLLTSEKRTLHVRALFDYDSQKDSGLPSKGLSFRYGDILHIINASDNEWWQARRVEGEHDSEEYGVVPGKLRVERRERARLKQVKFSHNQPSVIDKDSAYNHVKRKRSHTFSRKFPFYKSRENLDDGSDAENNQIVSSQSDSEASIKEDIIHSYEVVVQKELKYTRPVVLLGPFKDRINDDLLYENPDKFSSCVPHTTRPAREDEVNGREYHFVNSRQQMEEDIKNNFFIEAGQYNDNLYGTSVQSVKDVAEQGKHCILDVSGNAIKRLQVAGLWPIAIFIKPPSVQWLMEMNKRLVDEQARKIFERAERQENEFGEYFTAIVRGETVEQLHENVTAVIKEQSRSRVWLPLNEEKNSGHT